MTNGFGAMPPYAVQVPVQDRWKIIAYIRALQLSQSGTINDVPAAERASLGTGGSPATGAPSSEGAAAGTGAPAAPNGSAPATRNPQPATTTTGVAQ
jgi:hypothetical protein